MSGHQPFNNLRQQLSPAQLARVAEHTVTVEQEIGRLELETAIKSSLITWQPDPSATALDNIDACLNHLRQTISALGGELKVTAQFQNDIEVSIASLTGRYSTLIASQQIN